MKEWREANEGRETKMDVFLPEAAQCSCGGGAFYPFRTDPGILDASVHPVGIRIEFGG
jgi:hypothetical protein